MNSNLFNKKKVYEVYIKEKEHELDVSMKDADMELTKALGNHHVIKEANNLAERQGKETF